MTITSDDIRHFMLDRGASDNFILDDAEFDEATILRGMQFVVDGYNSMAPYVESFNDIGCFPYRKEAILGVAAYCLRAKAMNFKRNEGSSRTEGGTSLDDRRGKSEAYLAMADRLSQESKESLQQIKISINVESCYNSFY